MRLFVALELAAADRAALAAWAAAIGDPALRPVSEGSLHITLAFLGEVDDHRPLVDVVRSGMCAPGRTSVTGALWLAPRRPHVLTVAVGGALEALHGELRASLEDRGFRVEQQPFRPHVTVARVRGRPRTLEVPEPPARALHPPAVTLFCSHLGRGPARYEALASRELPTLRR